MILMHGRFNLIHTVRAVAGYGAKIKGFLSGTLMATAEAKTIFARTVKAEVFAFVIFVRVVSTEGGNVHPAAIVAWTRWGFGSFSKI